VRSSDGTTPSTLGARPLATGRGQAPLVFLFGPLPSFSQITSTGLVDVEDILEAQSREKTEEEEEEAEEEIDEA
jgi:hypothetical protein